ncbi:IS1595 family transposase [Xenorhabdus sp. 42]|uniref:IS1595 family transposase n=1 Tax=Xenorhabdus szentirmaii TaxID=290112 RepID=UPI00199EB24B|nr:MULTISPECIES: IS1595 family transposase [unclassified Xenorhabdus]MBD2791992.1 IS1595 family transposase [Xenorhabdus sp. CUL]MBD2820855.1 IS1595 family transposase [Xenorhabdus sp. 42]MBD2823663.1 IS1595 family transposase [Xenorhabdus sp. 5]
MRKSKLSQYKQERLLELFIAGSTARIAAELVGIHRNTAAYYFHRLRILIAEHVDKHSWFEGEIEINESYFGGHRKGQRGRGAAGKVPVFGLLKRGGKVYTQVIPDAKSRTLLPIIESKICPDSIVYTDNFASYDVLDVSDFKHDRINHSPQFVDKKAHQNHINGIENFWDQTKRHMRKFNGIPKVHFELYLKECEWRFNTPSAKQQLAILKQHAFKASCCCNQR